MTVNSQTSGNKSATRSSLWQRSSLKTKTVIIAIALSVLPVIVAETVEFWHEDALMNDKIAQDQEAKAILLAEALNRFMSERYSDVQVISNLAILNDSRVATETSLRGKQKILNQFIQFHPVYDSIAFIEPDGKPTLTVGLPASEDYKDSDFFKEAMTTKRPVVGAPRKSEVNGVYSIFIAAPVIDTVSEKLIGVVRTRMPANKVEEVFQNNPYFKQREHLFIDREGLVFSGTRKEEVGQAVSKVFPAFPSLSLRQGVATTTAKNSQGTSLLTSYVPLPQLATGPNLKWSILLAQNLGVLQAEQQRLVLIYIGIVAASIIGIGAIAAVLSKRIIRPILEACAALQKLGQGDFNSHLNVQGDDELAVLGRNINHTAHQLRSMVQKKETEVERAQLIRRIISHMSESLKREEILKAVTEDTRQALKVDRVMVYQLEKDWSGSVVQEAVNPDYASLLCHPINQSWFVEGYRDSYRQGETVSTPNVYEAGLTRQQIAQLESLQVKANLTAPIFVDRQLIALLIAHQCSETRIWQPEEIDLFSRIAMHVGLAWEQSNHLARIETAWQDQRDEAKTLRSQLTQPLNQVETELLKDEKIVHDLTSALHYQIETSTQTLGVVEQITDALSAIQNQVQELTGLIQVVSTTAESGEIGINRSVQQFETVQDAIDKATQILKRLGESFDRVIQSTAQMYQSSLKIVAQTSVFAVNTSLEASRTQIGGGRLADLASTISELATRSVSTTQEVKQTMSMIQQEVSEVVALLELSTSERTAGTQSIQQAKQTLKQLISTSQQVEQFVRSITEAAQSQGQTAQTAANYLNTIVNCAEHTLSDSNQVSTSLRHVVENVQHIQSSVH